MARTKPRQAPCRCTESFNNPPLLSLSYFYYFASAAACVNETALYPTSSTADISSPIFTAAESPAPKPAGY